MSPGRFRFFRRFSHEDSRDRRKHAESGRPHALNHQCSLGQDRRAKRHPGIRHGPCRHTAHVPPAVLAGLPARRPRHLARPTAPPTGKDMGRVLIYLGGNGHCTARLAPAREALARLSATGAIAPFALVEAAYPGFENRPRAADLDTFLDSVGFNLAQAVAPEDAVLLYGTGIGGLLALCLRARGEWTD